MEEVETDSEDESNGEEEDKDETTGFVFRPRGTGRPPPVRGQRKDEDGPADLGKQEASRADELLLAVYGDTVH